MIAFGGLAAFLGVGEIAAAGAETVITDGLAGPVAVIQVSGGIDLILVYGGGSIVARGGLVVAGGEVAGTAFC